MSTGCGDDDGNSIKVPDSAQNFEGENYKDVVKILEDAGYTNVKTEVIDDLVTGWLTKEDSVERVSIDGHTDFNKGDKFAKDAEIVVTYHTFPEEDATTTEAAVEDDGTQAIIDGAVGKPAIDIKNQLEKLGYTVTFTHAVTKMDFTGEVLPKGDDYYLPWIVTDVDKYDVAGKTASFFINTQDMIDEAKDKKSTAEKLEAKLGASYAWAAVELYGKNEYPYGFKLKYVMGQLAETAEDDSTWFLKAECEVTNEFGTKGKFVCEARVTGTSEKPKVKDFKVY